MKIEQQQGFSAIGVSVRTNNRAEMSGSGKIGPLWHEFMVKDLAAKIPDRSDGDLLAVYTDYAGDEKDDYTYSIAVRVSSTTRVTEGLVALTIPAGRYAVYTTERGPVEQVVPALWKRIWSISPAEQGGARSFHVDYEVYPADTDPRNVQVTIYIGLK